MDFPKVESSPNWDARLFDHQLTAIYEMEKREKQEVITIGNDQELKSNIGIYADPTGYGKTLAMVGLLSRDVMEWDLKTKYMKCNITSLCDFDVTLTLTRRSQYKKMDCTLLLVNQSIINQWKNELNLLKVKYIIVDTKKKVDNLDASLHKLVVVTPTMYNRLVDKYRNVYWKRFVYDEPVNTNLPGMRCIRAGFNWFITATPNQLRCQTGSRSNHFLRGIFNYWTCPAVINALTFMNDLDYDMSSYVFHSTEHLHHLCYQPVFNMCRNYIDSTTSDMISAGNISGAIKRLGGNETSNIFDLIKNRLLHKIEDLNHYLNIARRHDNKYNIEKYSSKIKTVENQIADIKDQFTKRLDGDCSICLGKLDKPILLPCCQNIMCGECILEWAKTKTTCPLCRSTLSPANLIYIKSDKESPSNEYKEITRQKTKPETILDIIRNNRNGKFIVFSNYSETFVNIYNIFNNNGISYKELKGQTSTRNKNIDMFKKGELKVLFLNSKNNGAGINLQEATDIILYHEMSEDLKTQVIGRANRIGRKDNLFVHHLL